ncbi:hypothetical protein [Desulfurobacterium indicum]|uniref:Uncharacterized protein n=1 Tax=Desulfurobacterium indicum TaxID=1914305 RepID=A0A1R1MK95_9BACT|nr:hypothetical protein [Desulfurobacterium indicum]OMH40231.1 hypothetical protein BLW93_06385 [Desulfurobacterium indicum]
MIEVIKLGNLVYENAELKILQPTAFNESGEPTEFEEILNPIFPQDIDSLKVAFKDTLDWFTTRYINQKLQEIQEDLQDLVSESNYLEGVFLSLGYDINQVKAEVTKVAMGVEDIATAQANLSLPDEHLPYLERSVEIAKIFKWKEDVWKAEEQLEAKVDGYTDYESLLDFDVKTECETAYSEIPLEV